MKGYIEFYHVIEGSSDVDIVVVKKEHVVSLEIIKIDRYYGNVKYAIYLTTVNNETYTIPKNYRGTYFKSKKEARTFIDELLSESI